MGSSLAVQDVYVHAYRQLTRSQEIVKEIAAAGGSAEAIHFDVTDARETRNVLEEVLATGMIIVCYKV